MLSFGRWIFERMYLRRETAVMEKHCLYIWFALTVLVHKATATKEGLYITSTPFERDNARVQELQVGNSLSITPLATHRDIPDESQMEAGSDGIDQEYNSDGLKMLDRNPCHMIHEPEKKSEFINLPEIPSSCLGFEFKWKPDQGISSKLRGLPKGADSKSFNFSKSLSERKRILIQVLQSQFQTYEREHHRLPTNDLSPLVSFLAVLLSEKIAKSCRIACPCCVQGGVTGSEMQLGLPHQFFLPCAYQLLVMRPSYSEWRQLESVLTKFCTDWMIIILHERSLNYEMIEESQDLIAEKFAKMLQWISELLISSYSPEFIKKINLDWEELKATQVNRVRVCSPKTHPLADIFKVPFMLPPSQKSFRAQSLSKLLKYLIEQWQQDCHNGYPIRLTQAIGRSTLKKISKKNPPEKDMMAWNNWCRSISMIRKSAEYLNKAFTTRCAWEDLKRKNPVRLFNLIRGIAGEENSEKCSKSELEVLWVSTFGVSLPKEMINKAFEIPKFIIKPIGTSDTIYKLSFFLEQRSALFSSQYLVDKMETFFNLDLFLGNNSHKFNLSFLAYQKSKVQNADYQRKCQQKKKRKLVHLEHPESVMQ